MNYKIKAIAVSVCGVLTGVLWIYLFHTKANGGMDVHSFNYWLNALMAVSPMIAGPAYGVQLYTEGETVTNDLKRTAKASQDLGIAFSLLGKNGIRLVRENSGTDLEQDSLNTACAMLGLEETDASRSSEAVTALAKILSQNVSIDHAKWRRHREEKCFN